MNRHILSDLVQAYIKSHNNADAKKVALSKPVFDTVTSSEMAGQIAALQKAVHKLPTWYHTEHIYFPPLLSIEQSSSETTAAYKAKLAIGKRLLDLTSGFGVDSFFFSKTMDAVTSCEINSDLAEISAHNAKMLKANNIHVLAIDGLKWLKESNEYFDTFYVDPARRKNSGKVFRLEDCTPNVVESLPLLLERAERIIVKTAPLLDISVGFKALSSVSELHIVSVKNECKELLWVLDKRFTGIPRIFCSALNEQSKTVSFAINEIQTMPLPLSTLPFQYLYEPDVALLKSGAFNLIAKMFDLQKLEQNAHLYSSEQIKPDFEGRIFAVEEILSLKELKKIKHLVGNVVVRNFPEKAENLVKKYRITPDHDQFVIFTQSAMGYIAIIAKIIQHY